MVKVIAAVTAIAFVGIILMVCVWNRVLLLIACRRSGDCREVSTFKTVMSRSYILCSTMPVTRAGARLMNACLRDRQYDKGISLLKDAFSRVHQFGSLGTKQCMEMQALLTIYLAELLFAKGDSSEAECYLDKVETKIIPELGRLVQVRLCLRIGRMYIQEAKYEKAMKVANRAISLGPILLFRARCFYMLSESHMLAGQVDKALEICDSLTKHGKHGRSVVLFHYLMSIIFMRIGKAEDAE